MYLLKRHSILMASFLVMLLASLSACSNTVTVSLASTAPPAVTGEPTFTPTSAPTLTATPAAGACNVADFPTQTPGGPSSGFQYPPLTYFYDGGSAAGNHYYQLCSSGDAASILAFLQHSIPLGGWTITSVTATTLSASQTSKPVTGGFCPSVNITVGSHAGYPGEWDADFHPPASLCAK
jgi:hypothetical protein